MPAEAGIHAFRASTSPSPMPSGQKFFGVAFFQKSDLILALPLMGYAAQRMRR
jgi:hypothetical protein